METTTLVVVAVVGLSKAGSISSRRTLALDFDFG